MADLFFDSILNLWTFCCTKLSELVRSPVVKVHDCSSSVPWFKLWDCKVFGLSPFWGCLTWESALAAIWFTKNAPHRFIRGGGGSGWVKNRVGGSKVGWVGLVQNTPTPLVNDACYWPLAPAHADLCGSERVLTEPPDDLSCLTTPGVGCPGDGLLPVPLTRCIQTHTPSPCGVCRLR